MDTKLCPLYFNGSYQLFSMAKLILNKDKISSNNAYISYSVLILYNHYIEIKFLLLLQKQVRFMNL